VKQRVAFAYGAAGFGQRLWFACPVCGRRCRILYGGSRFKCRLCHGARYESQFESSNWRLVRRAQKIRMRLGGSPSLEHPFPAKPTKLRWSTYRRLKAQDAALLDRGTANLARNLMRRVQSFAGRA
jgi:hypothetical protein